MPEKQQQIRYAIWAPGVDYRNERGVRTDGKHWGGLATARLFATVAEAAQAISAGVSEGMIGVEIHRVRVAVEVIEKVEIIEAVGVAA